MTTLEIREYDGFLILLGMMDGYYVIRKQKGDKILYQSPPIKDRMKARTIYATV